MAADDEPVRRRREFVLFFDVAYGNPNGDPDAANLPRVDPETGHGLVSDAALKRRVRDYVWLTRGTEPGYDILVREGVPLSTQQARAWAEVVPDAAEAELRHDGLPRDRDKALALRRWMCRTFFDVRSFGAVMTVGPNCGQVRGPVQIAFARSVEPIAVLDATLTRVAPATERLLAEKGPKSIGRRAVVPYALFRAHGFVSAALASHPVAGTGFSERDWEVLREALVNLFEFRRSASEGEMAVRRLFVFAHASRFGNAPAHKLFETISVRRRDGGGMPPRRFADYAIDFDEGAVPGGISVEVWD